MKTLGVDPMPGIGKVAMRKYGVKTVEGFFGLNLTKKLFSTDSTFNIAAFGVLLITAFLYAMFW